MGMTVAENRQEIVDQVYKLRMQGKTVQEIGRELGTLPGNIYYYLRIAMEQNKVENPSNFFTSTVAESAVSIRSSHGKREKVTWETLNPDYS